MDGIRINQTEKYLLIFTLIVILFISLATILVLFFVFRDGKFLLGSMQDAYSVLIPFLLVLFIILTSCFMGFMAIIAKILLSRKPPEKDIVDTTPEEIGRMSDLEKGFLLQKLNEKKERIEYLIKLAEEKYYKRKLDSESFREITRDHQKKLMEIEVKIREIDAKLKEKEKKAP